MNEDERGHRWFALGYSVFGRLAEKELGQHRRRLISQASGEVVEIGSGTGLNFRYYLPPVSDVLATEPDPHMFKRARKASTASATRVPVRVERRTADALDIDTDSVDDVVTTLVLCSVPDQASALAEIRRVLKPGGRMLFFEHVRATNPGLAARQDKRERMWMRIAAGCHPNRDTEAAIRDAGFEIDEIDRLDVKGSKLVRPHILGTARKPAR